MSSPRTFVLSFALLAACGSPGEEISTEELFTCSSLGMSSAAEMADLSDNALLKLRGRIDVPSGACTEPAEFECQDFVDRECPPEGCCSCDGAAVLSAGGVEVPLITSISPPFCTRHNDGATTCWPFGPAIEYRVWGQKRTSEQSDALAVAGWCIPTDEAALPGVYEGRLSINGASGWDAPVIRLSISADGGYRFDLEDLRRCGISCRGELPAQQATDVAVGDGTVDFTAEVHYGGSHSMRFRLQGGQDCFYGDATALDGESVSVTTRLCRRE